MKQSTLRRLLDYGFSVSILRKGMVERYDQAANGAWYVTYAGDAGKCSFCGKPFGSATEYIGVCRCDGETLTEVPMASLYKELFNLANKAKIDSKSMSIRIAV